MEYTRKERRISFLTMVTASRCKRMPERETRGGRDRDHAGNWFPSRSMGHEQVLSSVTSMSFCLNTSMFIHLKTKPLLFLRCDMTLDIEDAEDSRGSIRRPRQHRMK